MAGGGRQQYKIKLTSGRILGPLDLDRIRLLISKDKIVGNELAREYPQGDWLDINQIGPIAELFLERAQSSVPRQVATQKNDHDQTRPLVDAMAPTQVLPVTRGSSPVPPPVESEAVELEEPAEPVRKQPEPPEFRGDQEEKTEHVTGFNESLAVELDGGTGETRYAEPNEEDEATIVSPSPLVPEPRHEPVELSLDGDQALVPVQRQLSREKTVMFQRSSSPSGGPGSGYLPGKRRLTLREKLVVAFISIGLGYFGYEFLEESNPPPGPYVIARARLPESTRGRGDPALSARLYDEAMRGYLADNVVGYSMAAEKLRKAASVDPENVKALAMLASTYLNLIDSLNKDENYFPVVSQLIELAKAKGVDLPELVIAEVEFFATVNRAEAAESRIVDFTKLNPRFNAEMFYYLAYALYHRGNFEEAAGFINQLPENRAFSPKLFHLKGLIAEALGEPDAAVREYEKAIAYSKDHMKSRLRIAAIYNKQGHLKDAAKHLDYLVTHLEYSSPPDLGQAFYLHGLLAELFQKWDIALADLEKAVRLDHGKSDYLLELYVLRGKAGDSPDAVKKPVRMYYFLAQGEKLLKEGKVHEALTHYLQARQASEESPIPLVKIGDMFHNLHDLSNARMNYKLATDRAPGNIEIWSKYINVLIESYDWEEAQKAMDKFRKLPVNQSSIDKAAADMYEKQGRHTEAQAFYRKAMSRENPDPEVYIAFAKSLLAVQDYKDAPFFFALALRYDPLNTEAMIGTAKAVAAQDSVDRGIQVLQDALQRGSAARAEFLSAIAELEIQKGEWGQAQKFVDQARAANPEYAYPWKIQAQIHLNQEGSDRNALEKALAAFKSYSDRNPSDPSGYLERYQVFIRQTKYDKALEELEKIYAVYPKYPKLHFYRGRLYSMMGNRKASTEEFQRELANHPEDLQTMVELGKELLLVDAPADALNYFSQAMSLAPKWAEPKHQAAYANYLLKNYPAAVALYQAALAYDPANSMIYKRLGLAYREMGDATSAAQAFRRYLEMEPDAPDRAQFQKYR